MQTTGTDTRGTSTDYPPLHLALIGAGRHAQALSIPALQLCSGIELVALCTGRPASAARARSRFGLPTYVGYEAVLARDDVEAVLIAATTDLHVALTVAALRAGKHVFCETPGILTPEDVPEVQAAWIEAGRVLMYGTHLRYAPIYEKLRALVPRVAEPGQAVLSIRFFSWVRHMYDLALHLLGDVTAVSCREGKGGRVAVLEFASGDLGMVHSGGPPNASIPLERVEVSGARGIIVADDGRELRMYDGSAAIDAHALGFADAPATVWSPTTAIPYRGLVGFTLRGYIPALEWFARSSRTGEPTLSGLDQAERTLRLERAVSRALMERNVVRVESSFLLDSGQQGDR